MKKSLRDILDRLISEIELNYLNYTEDAINVKVYINTVKKAKSLAITDIKQLIPEKETPYYVCSHCGTAELKEAGLFCWACGEGEMIYELEVQARNEAIDEINKALDGKEVV